MLDNDVERNFSFYHFFLIFKVEFVVLKLEVLLNIVGKPIVNIPKALQHHSASEFLHAGINETNFTSLKLPISVKNFLVKMHFKDKVSVVFQILYLAIFKLDLRVK